MAKLFVDTVDVITNYVEESSFCKANGGSAGHVAHICRKGMNVGFWWESQEGRDHKEDIDVGGEYY
jgi:hypothetical protein